MNDIWTLPSGEWIVYSDEEKIIKDFKSLADLVVVTSYHGIIKRHRAVQFKFPDREDILRYVCHMAGFEYRRVVSLLKHPGISYSRLFGEVVYQPPLFAASDPGRKGKGTGL
ncbi:MAG: hypothetical protein ACOY31_03045 [Bacillota bacterium]